MDIKISRVDEATVNRENAAVHSPMSCSLSYTAEQEKQINHRGQPLLENEHSKEQAALVG